MLHRRKFISFFIFTLLMGSFLTFSQQSAAQTPTFNQVYALSADSGVVGDLTVTVNGTTLTATFDFSESGLCLQGYSELYVWGYNGTDFWETRSFDAASGCTQVDVYQVALNSADTLLGLYANFDLENTTVTIEIPASFGEAVTFVTSDGGYESYLQSTVYSSTGALMGTYPSWCIDLQNAIYTGEVYGGTVYEDYPFTLPDNDNFANVQANLDLLNYIINQDYVAQGYTVMDIQYAIWAISNPEIMQMEDYALDHPYALMILSDAYANGAGFEPTCGQLKGVILEPSDGSNAQHQFVAFPVDCSAEPSYQTHTYTNWGEISITIDLTIQPTPEPTVQPTTPVPTTPAPTVEPTNPSSTPEPTVEPTNPPSTPEPTAEPTNPPSTPEPTVEPTNPPSTPEPTAEPTNPPVTPDPTEVLGCQKENPERLDCSSLQVSGSCSGTTAVFTITNTGEAGNGDMVASTNWRLYDANGIVQSGTVQLSGGSSMTVTYEGTGEARLEADQQVGHPGNSHPNAVLTCQP